MEIEFKHIAVEGVFHSGKTRLATLLAQRLGGKPVLDRARIRICATFMTRRTARPS